MLRESFEQVLYDDRISEVVIADDRSTDPEVPKFLDGLSRLGKVRVWRNAKNLGVGANKTNAISLATNKHCIIFDSDNVITAAYLDALEPCASMLDQGTILMPSMARPDFYFTAYQGQTIDSAYAKAHLDQRMFDCLLGVCNYAVNRMAYLAVYQPRTELIGADTIYFNYDWLKSGRTFFVVPGMEYDQRVHAGSNWLSNEAYNGEKFAKAKELIRNL